MIKPDVWPVLLALAGFALVPLAIALPWILLRARPGAPLLAAAAGLIDGLNGLIGRTVAWAVLLMVLIQLTIVIARYVFGVGHILLQESMLYLHGILFLAAAGYGLKVEAHVRVDVIYRTASPRLRHMIDLAGTYVLLLPMVLAVVAFALPYVETSWAIREGSRETSGIPYLYLLKSMILVFAALLYLQGLALAMRAILGLGQTAPGHGHRAAA